MAAFGTIDVVYSNAGIGVYGDGPDMDLEHGNSFFVFLLSLYGWNRYSL